MLNYLKLSVLAIAFSTSASFGHEFWIDPLDYSVAPGTPLQADLRVGQGFEGSPYAYIPVNFRLFELARGDVRMPVDGRIGDRPALNRAPMNEGLNVVLHVTKDYELSYTAFEKFEDFVRHKDASWAAERHKAAGYPMRGLSSCTRVMRKA